MKTLRFIKFFSGSIVLIFLFCYFMEYSGYYEYNLQNRRILTEEKMKLFEEDILNGKDIDLSSYLSDSYIDYSNSLTRTTSNVNLKLNDYLKEFITGSLDFLGKFIK